MHRCLPLAVAATTFLALAACGSSSPAGAPSPDPPPLPPGVFCAGLPTSQATTTPTKVLVVIGENTSATIVGAARDAPFMDGVLSRQCGLLTNMHNETHASEPNYHALAAGTFAPWAMCDFPPDTPSTAAHPCAYSSSAHYTTASIFQQVERAYGRTAWRTYAQSMATNCQRTDGANYAVRHNAAAFWQGINCTQDDVPLTQLAADSAAGVLPRFGFVIPDDDHNGHDNGVGAYDSFLSGLLGMLRDDPDYRAGRLLVVVTFDEGSAGRRFPDYRAGEDCVDPHQGNRRPSCHIDTWIVGRNVPHATYGGFTTHYSLLRSAELLLGLPLLGHAADPATADFLSPFDLAPAHHM